MRAMYVGYVYGTCMQSSPEHSRRQTVHDPEPANVCMLESKSACCSNVTGHDRLICKQLANGRQSV